MGFCSEVRTLKLALDTSILTALSKEILQGNHRLNRQGAV